MRRFRSGAALVLLLSVLIASVFPTGALALSGNDPLLFADLDRAGFRFDYVPRANGEYALCLFSADGGEVTARGEILENGRVIASGEGTGQICSAWLTEGAAYSFRLHGSGSAVVEVARCATSRSHASPLDADDGGYNEKMIARPNDAHWYAFTAAQDGDMLIACAPLDPGLRLDAMAFDANFALAGRFERLEGGAAQLRLETRAGEKYFLRICAPEGDTGFYGLNLHRAPQDAPPVAFDAAEYALAVGDRLDLAPVAGGGVLLWTSDAPDVAMVDQYGVVHGLREGTARISARGMDGRADCTVRVEHVPLQGVNLPGDALELSVGDEIEVHVDLLPANASDRELRFSVDHPALATVSRDGVLRGLQPGETMLTVTGAGGAQDSVKVIIRPAVRRYRALLVGEQSYPFAEDSTREGSDNSVQAIAGLLGTVRFEDASYSVRTETDLSRGELIACIRDSFKSAGPQDVSLLYITCHGSYSGGMSFLELSDGSHLAVRDLERELRGVSGTVVVMIDCCGSGGAIGGMSDRIAFARGVTGAFAGAGMRGSRYKVFASAGLDQDSFRIAFNEDAGSGVMATVFARALCDGAGWDIDRGERGTMGADRDFNGSITLGELQDYMGGRVNWYLDIASGLTGEDYRQTIQVYPEGDPLVLFGR